MVTVIELIDYNLLMSILDFLQKQFKDKKVNNKNIAVVQSYFDKHLKYQSPALSAEILYRKNRNVGFGSHIGEEMSGNKIIEIEGTLMEYRVQLNVYSNTRGEIHKWSSILDDVLKIGEREMVLNTYHDNGSIKQSAIGIIDYDYSADVKNNNLAPNVVTYDFHTIYELKLNVVQKYKIAYDIAEIGNIHGIINK